MIMAADEIRNNDDGNDIPASSANDGALILIRAAQADALAAHAELEEIIAAYRRVGIDEDSFEGVRRVVFAQLRIAWCVDGLNKLSDCVQGS